MQTSTEILEKCRYHFKERMFLPNYVLFEYNNNRQKIIEKQISAYNGVKIKHNHGYFLNIKEEKLKINSSIKKIKNYAENFKNHFSNEEKHPYFPKSFIDKFDKELKSYLKNIEELENDNFLYSLENDLTNEIDKQIENLKSIIQNDVILDKVESFFEIGNPYSFSRIVDIIKEGKFRFSELIPPGYKDADTKDGISKYADLIIWKQILDFGKENSCPIIFVSNDVKEDWNEIDISTNDKKNIKTNRNKPRYELLMEFFENTSENIKKITLTDFINDFNTQLINKFDTSTLIEIRLKDVGKLIKEKTDTMIFEMESEIIQFISSENELVLLGEDTHVNDESYVIDKVIEVEESIIDNNRIAVEYYISVQNFIEYEYVEYWGRDEDTKEVIASPPSTLTKEGEIIVKLKKNFMVEFYDDYKYEIHNEPGYEFEIFEDNRSIRIDSWDERIDYEFN